MKLVGWSDTRVSRGMPRRVSSPPGSQKEARMLQVAEGARPCRPLCFGPLAPRSMRQSAPAVLSPHPTCGTLPLQPGTGALMPPLCVPQGTPGPWCWGCPRPGPRWLRLAPGCSPLGTCPRGRQRLHHHCRAFSLSLPWCFQSEPVWFPDLPPTAWRASPCACPPAPARLITPPATARLG